MHLAAARPCVVASRRLARLEQSRNYFASSSASSSVVPDSRPCYAPVPNRGFISLTGPEPNLSVYLNGILATQVTPSTGEPSGFYSTFLSRRGRIQYDVFFHPHPDPSQSGYIVEFDPRPLPSELIRDSAAEKAPLPPLPALLKRFVLRSKVRVKDVSEEWGAWQAWGGEAERQAEQRREKVWTGWKWGKTSSAVEPSWLGRRSPDIRLAVNPADEAHLPFKPGQGTGSWDWRAPGMGRRVLLPKTEKPLLSDEYTLGTSFDYALHRIKTGVPEGVVDMAEAIPFERNVDIMGGVDFRKGCYVGQENVVRTYHTGMVRKRTIPVQLGALSSKDAEHSNESFRTGGDHLDPAPPRLSDISLRLTPEGIALKPAAASSRRPPDYVKTKGKLLSRAGDWALAQIRTEHLEAQERGEMTMFIESGSPDSVWKVTPRVPAWWPRVPKPDVAQPSATGAEAMM